MKAVIEETKAGRLVARVSRTHKELLERAAAIEGQSVASFIVTHAVDSAERVVREQETIRLNLEQSRRFADALLRSPRAATVAMKRANRAHRLRVTEL
jgi:uncharacterized protein (DUF1778 family)